MNALQMLKQAAINSIETETYTKNGVLYWKSNDQPVPPHVFKEAGKEMPKGQQEAYDATTEDWLEKWRNQKPTPEDMAEIAFELRTVHPRGTKVVNVLTGRRITV